MNAVELSKCIFQAADEVKYIKTSAADQAKQLQELNARIEENSSADSNQKKAFEDEIRSSLNEILASDDSRRAAFQLACDEEQQIVAVRVLDCSI